MQARALFLILCLAAALVPFLPGGAGGDGCPDAFPGWPPQLDERPLSALALGERDARFVSGFPGRVGKFTDGEREILIRWVPRPTRKLHSGADCFRGMGFATKPLPVRVDGRGHRWSAFEVRRGALVLTVRERIFNETGGAWTDPSGWYWSALMGRSEGPYWAVTVIEPAEAAGVGGEAVRIDSPDANPKRHHSAKRGGVSWS